MAESSGSVSDSYQTFTRKGRLANRSDPKRHLLIQNFEYTVPNYAKQEHFNFNKMTASGRHKYYDKC